MIERAINYYHSLCTDAAGTEIQAVFDKHLVPRHVHFGGRPLATVLRPHFLTVDQYRYIQRECAILAGAFSRAYDALMADPQLRAQMDLMPEEEEAITIDPGFKVPSPTQRIDTFFSHDGTLHCVELNAETPAGMGYQDESSDIFLGLPIMHEFMKRYDVRPLPTRWQMLGLLLQIYREWGGTGKPRIAILDWKEVPTYPEFELFQEYFTREGYESAIVDPREVEYGGGKLHAGDFVIDVIYKRVLGSELLQKGGLNHPVIQALRDRAVCMVNPFRCKLLHKKNIFGILTDEDNQHLFTTEQRRAIAEHIPWTRRVRERRTLFHGQIIDLIPFIVDHRDQFVLKPNDEYGGKGVVIGWESGAEEWSQAVQHALNEPYVVQEKVKIAREDYPALVDGKVQFGERSVDLDPYVFYMQYVGGCLTRLSATTLLNVTAGGGSTVPTFVLEDRQT